MSDLFEEDETELDEVTEDFEEVAVEDDFVDSSAPDLGARRRLERMLEEKQLRDELDDFVDY